ncbi:MAG: epoxyqueuosine reductase QueH, partial [Oscillospiraceae bacterium]
AKLNEIGFALEQEYNVKYLPADFKKKNGYKRSLELSKEYGLYRQSYCGCAFSLAESQGRRA